MQVPQQVAEFLAQKRIAVAGVSRSKNEAANFVYRKLRESGYEVFAINPRAEQVEGDPCYGSLAAVPGPIDGLVVVTRPETAEAVVDECAALGISRVWFHRSFGAGSLSPGVVRRCEEKGIVAIAGGCPMMFVPPVDFGHRCMRWILRVAGRLPVA